MTINDLEALVTLTPADEGEPSPTFELETTFTSDQVLAALAVYFGEDDARKGIVIVSDGVHAGKLSRTALYSAFKPAARGPGLGGGAHGSLPGRGPFRLIPLTCPVAGCGETRLVMSYDEDDPPKCPRHPSSTMRPV
jgi:hypothetical protein